MSLCVEDPDRIRESIAKVQSSTFSDNWVLCGRLKSSKNVLKFIRSGTGGLEEINSHLQHDDMLVVYGLVNLEDSLVFVTWYYSTPLGERLISYSREISVLFMPYHSWIHIDLWSNMSLKDILENKKYSKPHPESITVN